MLLLLLQPRVELCNQSILECGLSFPGSSPGMGNIILFLGKILYPLTVPQCLSSYSDLHEQQCIAGAPCVTECWRVTYDRLTSNFLSQLIRMGLLMSYISYYYFPPPPPAHWVMKTSVCMTIFYSTLTKNSFKNNDRFFTVSKDHIKIVIIILITNNSNCALLHRL